MKMELVDLDKACRVDMMTGKGFRITEPPIDNNDNKNKYGIQSPIFATEWSDVDAFEERYACQCGAIKGKIFVGETCPKCKTTIEFRDTDLSITGWIMLDEFKVMQPALYHIVEKIIGENELIDIISYHKKVGRDGDLRVEDPKSEFSSIGLEEFRERFWEIIHKMKKKNKKKYIKFLEDNEDKIWTSSIPVYSSVLRPMAISGDRIAYTKVDKMYGVIFTNSKLLSNEALLKKRRKSWKKNKRELMTIPQVLFSIQTRYVELWDYVFNEIDQKEGTIKQNILGGMLNFTARNVIIPDPTLKANEIRLCYMSFLELFKYEIIGTISKLENIMPAKAEEQWYRARVQYSQKIYEIMCFINETRKPRVIINRNPTINYGSLLCVKIKSIKAEFNEDYTMSMPPQILPAMNADFDGDILNIISIKFKEIEKAAIKGFDPVRNLFISRIDGLLNDECNLYKDQLIGLYQFNNI